MVVKAKYTWNPTKNHLKNLKVGDYVQMQKGHVFQVLDIYKVDDRTAYWTDNLGLVFQDELELIQQ